MIDNPTAKIVCDLRHCAGDGCSHCNNSTAMDTLWEPGGAHDFRIQDGAIYYYDSASGWEGEAIRFCPWCGRMIDKEERDENREGN